MDPPGLPHDNTSYSSFSPARLARSQTESPTRPRFRASEWERRRSGTHTTSARPACCLLFASVVDTPSRCHTSLPAFVPLSVLILRKCMLLSIVLCTWNPTPLNQE